MTAMNNLMTLANITGYRLSKITGINGARICLIRNGKVEPSKNEAKRLETFWGRPINLLMENTNAS